MDTLPIDGFKAALLGRISSSQVVVVVGQTGSGKSTRIPNFILEDLDPSKTIGCTQPRRIAAVNVATRVSKQLGVRLGSVVGYKVRFDDCTSRKTKIKYMTDGVLLRELLSDPLLHEYSFLMIDEAHERSISTDILLSFLKIIIRKRPEFRLIIASATLDWRPLQSFFNAELFFVPGREHPISVQYCLEPQKNYLECLYKVIASMLHDDLKGNVLVFLTGQEDIELSSRIINSMIETKGLSSKILSLPLYSSLPPQEQSKVFDHKADIFKVILATNVAETSITIPGVRTVIDAGLQKISMYNPRTRSSYLVTVPIAKASAKQRAGRAGRTAPGDCIRLYTHKSFENEMSDANIPEIKRVSFSSLQLLLSALHIRDISAVQFLSRPTAPFVIEGIETLMRISCIDSEGSITKKGRILAEFPFNPLLSNLIYIASQHACLYEAVILCSITTSGCSVFETTTKGLNRLDPGLINASSDHETLLNIWRAFTLCADKRAWCRENGLQFMSLKTIGKVYAQLLEICRRLRFNLNPSPKTAVGVAELIYLSNPFNVAVKQHDTYYIQSRMQVVIHPGSVLSSSRPRKLVFSELNVINGVAIVSVCSEIKN
jgi:pre-mRNA-splicing factor ATP-dependent RNA helicase DHX16